MCVPPRCFARILPLGVTSRQREKEVVVLVRVKAVHLFFLPPPPHPSPHLLLSFCFVCAHFIPCAASWQAGQGLPSHHTPFPSHAAWGRNTRRLRQGQAQTAHTTLPPSPPLTLLIGSRREKKKVCTWTHTNDFILSFLSPSFSNYTFLVLFSCPPHAALYLTVYY